MAESQESMEKRRYSSLDEAFRDQRTLLVNQQFIRRLVAAIEVEGYYRYANHFRVTRRDGGPWLEVHRGATNGFRSPEEVTDAVPHAEVTPSVRIGTWRAVHPDTTSWPDLDGAMRRARRSESVQCPECGDVLSVSGLCNNPDCVMFGIAS